MTTRVSIRRHVLSLPYTPARRPERQAMRIRHMPTAAVRGSGRLSSSWVGPPCCHAGFRGSEFFYFLAFF